MTIIKRLGDPLEPAAERGIPFDLDALERQREAKAIKSKFDAAGKPWVAKVYDVDGARPQTVIVDDEGENAFELAGNFDVSACREIVLAHQRGYNRGVDAGRTELQAELRRLLGAPGYGDVEPRRMLFGG
jgi:hypothetical protein